MRCIYFERGWNEKTVKTAQITSLCIKCKGRIEHSYNDKPINRFYFFIKSRISLHIKMKSRDKIQLSPYCVNTGLIEVNQLTRPKIKLNI